MTSSTSSATRGSDNVPYHPHHGMWSKKDDKAILAFFFAMGCLGTSLAAATMGGILVGCTESPMGSRLLTAAGALALGGLCSGYYAKKISGN